MKNYSIFDMFMRVVSADGYCISTALMQDHLMKAFNILEVQKHKLHFPATYSLAKE